MVYLVGVPKKSAGDPRRGDPLISRREINRISVNDINHLYQ